MTGYDNYGWYRFGRYQFRPQKFDRGEPYEKEGPSEEELFGAGVALKTADEHGVPWDFVSDSSGDLGATKGLDELSKDVAFRTAQEARSLIGTLATPNDHARMENDIQRIAADDSRVTDATIDVMTSPSNPSHVDIGMVVGTETEELPEFVFPMEW